MPTQSTLTCWRKSFDFFKPDSLNVFILATLNTFIRSGKVIFRNFWWLFLIDLAFVFFTSPLITFPAMITSAMIFYVMIATARPSLEEKSWDYYMRYKKANFMTLFYAFFQGIVMAFFVIFMQSNPFALGLMVLAVQCFIHIILFLPSIFFYLDSNLSFRAFFKAIKQALKMLFNFLPIMFILTIFWTVQYIPTIYMPSLDMALPFRAILHVLGKIHFFFDYFKYERALYTIET